MLRSSSCCCSNSGTAAMATRASSEAVWLCEERRSWAAAAAGVPLRGGRGPASANLPAGRLQEASGLRHHPSCPGKGQRRATCSPRAASPVPTAVHLGAGQRSYVGPTLAPGHAETADRGCDGDARQRTLPARHVLEKTALKVRGNLLLSQGPRWRRAVT